MSEVVDSVSFRRPDGTLRTLDEIEAIVIENAIETCQGSMSAVARALGIGRSTLYRKGQSSRIEKPFAVERLSPGPRLPARTVLAMAAAAGEKP